MNTGITNNVQAVSFADAANMYSVNQVPNSQLNQVNTGMQCNGNPGMPQYSYNQGVEDFYRYQMELSFRADKRNLDNAALKEAENIRTEAACVRKAHSLDLQTRHENRWSEVRFTPEGTPVFRNEMLAENNLEKPVANIRSCEAIIYRPDIIYEKDKVKRILEFRYYDNQNKRDEAIYLDITNTDESLFYKQIKAKGMRLCCGRRKKLEYAENLFDALKAEALEMTVPRYRGFTYIHADNTWMIDYVTEEQITWKDMVRLCM